MFLIKKLSEIRSSMSMLVGGKNASLGEMMHALNSVGIIIPDGFAVTTEAYYYHLKHNNIDVAIGTFIDAIKLSNNVKEIQDISLHVRNLIEKSDFPDDLSYEICTAYRNLSCQYDANNIAVAVRSSAISEDSPNASFAGQQESFLNITNEQDLLYYCRKSMASLFSDRAIIYRIEKGFDSASMALAICVQKMVRSDIGSSGVVFTLDPDTGFNNVLVMNASWGLGESIVNGNIIPDEYHVSKYSLSNNFYPIIRKTLGNKESKIVLSNDSDRTIIHDVSYIDKNKFCLSDDQILELSHVAMQIESYFSQLYGYWQPMDIEWAYDGNDQKLYILQARPETIHSVNDKTYVTYHVEGQESAKIIVSGQSVGQKSVSGIARVIHNIMDIGVIKSNEIIVTSVTDPDWVPIMKMACGIITENGGRTCHTAIVSRELGIPALVGAYGAMSNIKTGDEITLNCSTGLIGYVYSGILPIATSYVNYDIINSNNNVQIMLNIAAPDRAYNLSKLPVDGVGLARIEFIISNYIQIHPMAFINSNKIDDPVILDKINRIISGYASGVDFFIESLAHGIATIAAAFHPRPVIVRFSDFKSNEYRGLIGGEFFEPVEENPMIGLRGASRYYHEMYKKAFELECLAMKRVIEIMGFSNVIMMVPFVRTLNEARHVVDLLKQYGLRGKDTSPKLYMMCEIPANVILLENFAEYFDGFSIGSNDLTQTVLSVDRDSGFLTSIFDEHDPAVMFMLETAIKKSLLLKKPIGICGQAPSDHPDIAALLIKWGINSLSLNADSIVPFLLQNINN